MQASAEDHLTMSHLFEVVTHTHHMIHQELVREQNICLHFDQQKQMASLLGAVLNFALPDEALRNHFLGQSEKAFCFDCLP